jgi:hypothetical protein
MNVEDYFMPVDSPYDQREGSTISGKKVVFALVTGIVVVTALLMAANISLRRYFNGFEQPRLQLLRKIEAAQKTFKDRDADHDGKRDYGTLAELIKAHLISDSDVSVAGLAYCEPAASAPQNRWWAVVDPRRPVQGKSFFVNQSGVIYFSATPVIKFVNRKTGEAPEGMAIYTNS